MKLNKFVFILLNLCPLVLGCGEEQSFLSEITKKDKKPYDKTAYEAFLEFAREQKDENGLHLFFFNVGHGNFILLRDKYNAIIVDAGAEKKTVAEGYIRELFLACLGKATLRQIIITHDHEDHTHYIEDVKKWAKAYKQGELSSVQNPFHSPSRVIKLKLVQIKTIKGFEGINSIFDMFPIHNTSLSFLQPLTKITTKNKNDKSSVFVLTYDNIKVLFTGDATGLSLDNYVEKHQERNNDIVAVNRELLKDIHLFVMPHHGSFTEDSFRWAFYVTKHSPGLLASVICEDPHISGYQGLQTGIRDFPWPMSMRNKNINNFIYYWSRDPAQTGRTNKYDLHKRQTNAALFITGAEPCCCVYFKIQSGNLYKYDSTKQNFVHLNGSVVTFDELYEDNDEVVNTVYGEEDENTPGEMQMRNIPINCGGFSMNGSTQEMKTMEEIEFSRIEQKEMKEEKPDNDNMSEEEFTFINPSNVYKFQDALDDDNDYMAYAS